MIRTRQDAAIRRGRPAGTAPSRSASARMPLLLAAIALALTVAGSWAPSMWADELATAEAVSSLDVMRETLGERDAVFLPYYLLMYAWTRLGTVDWWLRLPSALATAAATGLLADLGRRLGGARAGVVAGILLAALPAISRFGQEARPYALAVAASVFAFWSLHRALETGRWARYVLAVALIPCTHLFAVLSLPAHLVVSRRCLPWLALGSPAALAVAAVSAGQVGQVNWLEAPGWENLVLVRSAITAWQPVPEPGHLPALLLGWAVALAGLGAAGTLLLRRAASGRTRAGDGTGAGTGAGADTGAGGDASAGDGTGAGGGRAAGRPFVLGLLVWGVLPAPVLFAVSHLITPVYSSRYVLFAAPAFALLAGLGAARLPRTALVAALGVAVALGARQQVLLRTEPGHQVSYRAAAEIVAAQRRDGDAIAYVVPWARQGLTRYAPMPPEARLGAGGDGAGDGAGRVWLVRSDQGRAIRPGTALPSRSGVAPGMVPKVDALLDGGFTVARSWPLRGVTVLLLERPAPAKRR
ncbi:glycosyltransferase family 39 protein [Planomonospora sp. ID82291]|uniref:glycosyltransferase family 39 protein n=1 Tax=Planomonospora sp. ID82291 TaxID=2738136 RepID=UPI0018C40F69|nr:glycosyltransferase family 39 protein [Planomonospora sp. ID82291]MBG0813525.1 glycosyltransferase family 39 protein [Planomonospora sp. ID82291]